MTDLLPGRSDLDKSPPPVLIQPPNFRAGQSAGLSDYRCDHT